MAYAYSIDPSAPPVSQKDWDSCFLAKTSAHLCRNYSLSFKRPIPNLGGGRLGGQGNMFVDKMFKLRYKNEQNITLSVSFTYNSPICSLKIKVHKSYVFQFITLSHPKAHSTRHKEAPVGPQKSL